VNEHDPQSRNIKDLLSSRHQVVLHLYSFHA
jgi:hypothetical protein